MEMKNSMGNDFDNETRNIFDDENNVDVKGYEVSGKYNSYMREELGLGSNLIQDIEVEEDRTKEDEFRDKLISAAHNYGVNDAEYMVTAYSIIDERRKEKDERKRELDKLKYVMYIGLFIVVCSVLSGIGRGLSIANTKSTIAVVTSVRPSLFLGQEVYVSYSIDGVDYEKIYLDKYLTPPAKNSVVTIHYKKSNPKKISNGRVFGGSVGINLLFGFLLTALGALYKIGIGNNVDDVHLDRRWKYRKYFRK